MTKLNLPVVEEVPRTPAAAAATAVETDEEKKFRVFMKKAADAAVELSPIFTREIESRNLQPEQAILAVMLFVANLAGKFGARRDDFVATAEQAFNDCSELFASPVVEVLKAARVLLAKGFCQGNLAKKWRKDVTVSEGKVLVDCHYADPYASRWSVVGAVSKASDAPSNLKKALECLMIAIVQSGYPVQPGSLIAITVQGWNDYGTEPGQLETRTQEQALALMDQAIVIAGRP